MEKSGVDEGAIGAGKDDDGADCGTVDTGIEGVGGGGGGSRVGAAGSDASAAMPAPIWTLEIAVTACKNCM